ncbi:MAG: cation transporter [Pseudomonadales bacterium]
MSDCGCGSIIPVEHLEAKQRRVLLIVMIINCLAFAGMVSGSVVSGSSALLSGTLDNLGDALAYLVSLAVLGASAAAKARAALFKSMLMGIAALVVFAQLILRGAFPLTPIAEVMGLAAVANLIANGVCFALLTPHRADDINMASVWHCSRNDLAEGLAVVVTAAAVYWTASPLPDLLIGGLLLLLFSHSAVTTARSAWNEMIAAPA